MPALPWVALLACTRGNDDSDLPAATWTVLAEDLPTAVLSIYGDDVDDLWLVGADVGSGPFIRHHTAAGWTAIETGSAGDLWWVWSEGENVWMVGADGRVVSGTATGSVWTESILDPAVTLFGIWGASGSDIWTVGGDVSQASDAARMWHFDGASWSEVALPAGAQAALALYKVWGRSATEVFAVGTGGLLLEWDGATWSETPSGTSQNLFTVHGDATRAYAVGGAYSGTIVARDAGGWVDETPPSLAQMNGVYVREGCDPIAAGTQAGTVFVRGADGWAADPRESPTFYDFHGAWLSPDCDALLVGGALSASPLTSGVVVWGGQSELQSLQ